jgi:hypothetical protein
MRPHCRASTALHPRIRPMPLPPLQLIGPMLCTHNTHTLFKKKLVCTTVKRVKLQSEQKTFATTQYIKYLQSERLWMHRMPALEVLLPELQYLAPR